MEQLIPYEQREFVLISDQALQLLGCVSLKRTEWELLKKFICDTSINNEASLYVGPEDYLTTLFSYLTSGGINCNLLENNISLQLKSTRSE